MKQVEELFRGEVSAIRSIDAILDRIKDDNEVRELTSIRQDHINARNTLRKFMDNDVETEEAKSGPWSAFASAFTGGASFFGDKAATRALKVGEEHGVEDYREALKDDNIRPELRQVISSELLPQQQRHLDIINKYLS